MCQLLKGETWLDLVLTNHSDSVKLDVFGAGCHQGAFGKGKCACVCVRWWICSSAGHTGITHWECPNSNDLSQITLGVCTQTSSNSFSNWNSSRILSLECKHQQQPTSSLGVPPTTSRYGGGTIFTGGDTPSLITLPGLPDFKEKEGYWKSNLALQNFHEGSCVSEGEWAKKKLCPAGVSGTYPRKSLHLINMEERGGKNRKNKISGKEKNIFGRTKTKWLVQTCYTAWYLNCHSVKPLPEESQHLDLHSDCGCPHFLFAWCCGWNRSWQVHVLRKQQVISTGLGTAAGLWPLCWPTML